MCRKPARPDVAIDGHVVHAEALGGLLERECPARPPVPLFSTKLTSPDGPTTEELGCWLVFRITRCRAGSRRPVIGAGVSGLTASYLLQRRYDVTLFESDPRLGGHAHTLDVITAGGDTVDVDTGFIVRNHEPIRSSPVSRSSWGSTPPHPNGHVDPLRGLWARVRRGWTPAGLLARPRRRRDSCSLECWSRLARFQRQARHVRQDASEKSLGDFLVAARYPPTSSPLHPARGGVGVVSLSVDRPSLPGPIPVSFPRQSRDALDAARLHWRTVPGGSRRYVEKVVKHLSAINTPAPVRAVIRHADGVEVRDDGDHNRPSIGSSSPLTPTPHSNCSPIPIRGTVGAGCLQLLPKRNLPAHRRPPAPRPPRRPGLVELPAAHPATPTPTSVLVSATT